MVAALQKPLGSLRGGLPEECRTRVSCNSVKHDWPPECRTRVPWQSVLQECLRRCQTRVSQKNLKQEFQGRVSKNVAEEGQARVSHKSALQRCAKQDRVLTERATQSDVTIQIIWHSGSWASA